MAVLEYFLYLRVSILWQQKSLPSVSLVHHAPEIHDSDISTSTLVHQYTASRISLYSAQSTRLSYSSLPCSWAAQSGRWQSIPGPSKAGRLNATILCYAELVCSVATWRVPTVSKSPFSIRNFLGMLASGGIFAKAWAPGTRSLGFGHSQVVRLSQADSHTSTTKLMVSRGECAVTRSAIC
jgi:hypothetical protein